MSSEQNDKENFVNFRLNKIEESISALATWPSQANLQVERLTNLTKKVEEQHQEIKIMRTEIDSFKMIFYKASGILVVLSIIVQLFGPFLINKVFSEQPKTELKEK